MLNIIRPEEIEKRSFEIIEEETKKIKGSIPFSNEKWQIVRRIIHTTADFDVLDNIVFHPDAIEMGKKTIKNGCIIVTDTNMAKAGISKARLKKFNVEVKCFVSDEDVVKEARIRNCTRSMVAIEKAVRLGKDIIFGIGNAPTAIFHLIDLMEKGEVKPALILGMVVGFVGAAKSKEELISRSIVPYIVLKGRKGGSPIVAATINAFFDLC
ncbi:precorrin-8X methylmutase [Desulfothermus naphthae]